MRRPGLLLLTLLSFTAAAQTFPSRPLELVIHTGPGAGADRIARLISEILTREKLITQPIVVTNRTGGAGTVAYNYMKTKRGDPHVILASVGSTIISASLRPEFNVSLDNFTMVARLAQDPQAVIVSADSPWRSFKELIDTAKREPVALVAVMGGHTQLSTENVSEGMPAIQAKKLRVLAVSTNKRMAAIPDTPTLRELGYNIHIGSVRGMAMPAGVPKEAVEHMEAALYRVYQSQAWQQHAASHYYENSWMGSAEFTKYMLGRREWVREFLKSIGATK